MQFAIVKAKANCYSSLHRHTNSDGEQMSPAELQALAEAARRGDAAYAAAQVRK